KSEKYFVKEEIKSGILGYYFRLGYRVVPRFTLYLLIYLFGLTGYFFFVIERGDTYIQDPSSILLLLLILFGISVFIYESLNIWRKKPI
ncbi:MAG: hypothetical protein ACXAB2_10365, partial [Candidatus Hodarchaeales archaeon]